jgi:hypothetical protein
MSPVLPTERIAHLGGAGDLVRCGISMWPMSARGQKHELPRRSIAVRFNLNEQTPTGRVQCDAVCRFCCKSPKLPGANFSAVEKSDRRPPFDVASITLPRSPASLSSGDEVPHIFTRNSRVQPKEILITSAKRLLQQNLPIVDSYTATNYVHGCNDLFTQSPRRRSFA